MPARETGAAGYHEEVKTIASASPEACCGVSEHENKETNSLRFFIPGTPERGILNPVLISVRF
jgi:hypothetical protein